MYYAEHRAMDESVPAPTAPVFRSKSHPCGAGLGLLGVAPSGDISPCHRFVDSYAHKLGHISTGVDREGQADFLERGGIHRKPECHTCWARPVCSGGCYHEAYVRYGDTGHANLHYCDWIRGWTHVLMRGVSTASGSKRVLTKGRRYETHPSDPS